MPKIGDIVHYMAHGSADGTYPMTCRAAIVTDVDQADPRSVSLCVFNPEGIFLKAGVVLATRDRDEPTQTRGAQCTDGTGWWYVAGGTWHHRDPQLTYPAWPGFPPSPGIPSSRDPEV
jgi:hypothetical protein